MKIQTTAWIWQWNKPRDFTLILETETEEDRSALFDAMRNRSRVKVTIEIDKE